MPAMQSYLAFLLVSMRLGLPVLAQDQQVQFNQVVNLNGDMQLNRLSFPDGSRIETFSQTQRQILVNQNTAPLNANHVTGSTGQPFVQLSPNSMTIATNNASDLVAAQIEMPIQQNILQQNNISPDNTFVAMLAPDRQTWIVMEGIKSVNTTDNTVRMVKLNNIDGEYMAIGRQTTETSVVLTPFSTDPNQSVRINGSGIQEVEFQDGFRMSVKATQPMTVNTNVVNGISNSMITDRTSSVNNYRYLVTTNLAAVQPNLNNMMAVVQLPLNAQRVMDLAVQMGAGPADQISLGIEQRPVIPNPGGAVGNLNPANKRQVASSSTSTGSSTVTDGTATSATDASSSTATDGTNGSSTSTSANADATQPPQDQNNNPTPTQNTGNTGGNTGGNNNNGNNNNNNNPAATQLLLAPTFSPLSSRNVLDRQNGRIAATVSQLDGEFIVTMAIGGQPGQQQPGQGQQQPGQGQLPPQQGQPQQGQLPGQAQPQPGQVPGQNIPQQGQAPTRELPGSPINGTNPIETPGAAVPGAIPGAVPGSAGPGGIPGSAVPGAIPGAVTRRQLAPSPPAQNQVIMSMSELAAMVQIQRTGNYFPTGAMMAEFAQQQGVPAAGAPLPIVVKERSVAGKKAVRFSG